MSSKFISTLVNSIAEDRSKDNILFWREKLINKPDAIPHVVPHIFEAKPTIGFRYAWLLEHLADARPDLASIVCEPLFNRRDEAQFEGYKRSLMKLMTLTGVPEDLEGEVVSVCFDWLINPEIEVAIKVHSMQVIFNLLGKYPDLTNEFKMVVEEQMELCSIAFRARAKRLLKKL